MILFARKSVTRLAEQAFGARKGLSMMGLVLLVAASVASVGTRDLSAKAQASRQQLPNALADKKMLTRLASGTVRQFKYPDKPKAPIEVSFYDEKGEKRSLKDWRGKTVLLNFWAPWCDSCVRELPSLQKLRRRLDRQDFEIVIINIESDVKKGRAFLDKLGIKNLASMMDRDKTALKKLDAIGIPTNILFDCHGRELGRLKGSAEWHADAAILLTKGLMRAAGCYDDKRELL